MAEDEQHVERKLAERVRRACIEAAISGYERAAWDGLCEEGAWECAVEAMRSLDLDTLLRDEPQERPG